MPAVAAIVVTWNSAAVLPGLLASIDAGMGTLDRQVIIADNASSDDTVEVARRMAPDCLIVHTGRNAGYAAAINAGLAAADPYDAVLVLNPDIRLEPGCVEAMYAHLAREGTGIVVPRIRADDGTLAWSLRREPTVLRALGEAVLGERAGRFAAFGESVVDEAAYERPATVDWATGAIMLVSAGCQRACGPWDESFFLYSEETEFSLRARDRGYLTRYAPEAVATHKGGESNTSPRLWSLLTVNRVKLYRQRHSLPATALFWTAVLLREASRAARGDPRARKAAAALLDRQSFRTEPA
jgi:N-acetylglucosaminyl-diphospho-decaprenol L-rhamnosyltransferase